MVLHSHRVYSDIFAIENIVQQTGVMHSKNILIDTLRDVFRVDRQYKYVQDVFGFPKTPSNLGLDSDAGLDDEETTRIFIGSTYRYDVKFHPSVIVKYTGGNYVPIAFNQNYLGTTYGTELLMDGYGTNTIIRVPRHKTIVGAWDQTFEIRIITESEVDREELADLIQIVLMGTRRKELEKAGLFIKRISTTGEIEEPYANDTLYIVSINVSTRTEWKVHIPIASTVERIVFYMTFDSLTAPDTPATGLTINEEWVEAFSRAIT